MVKRLSLLLLALLALQFQGAMAQVATEATPFSSLYTVSAYIDEVNMGPIDVNVLLAEDAIEEAQGLPYRFGYGHDVNLGIDNAGSWETINKGDRIWRLKITCPSAYSINLIYDQYELADGAQLFVYNEDRSMIIGAFTSNNNKEHGQFSTGLVSGDVCIVEYNVPAGVDAGKLNISRIVHGYKDIIAGYGDSGSCNNNVHCPEGAPWANEIRAVAMIVTSGGTRLCSGSLVNNVRQDQTPYFLTANHCLGGESTWIFMFNYESPTCANQNGPTNQTVSGCVRKANYSTSDFGLLLLNENPPPSYSVFFAGWSNVNTASPNACTIHHPSGDIKKITFDYDPITSTEYLNNAVDPNASHWRIGSWNDGTTEPGSSGSPLYDNNRRTIGQLHGGYASCTSITSDWYGKFARSWTGGGTPASRLIDWLDPDNTGATVLDGLDPNNLGPQGVIAGRVTDAQTGQGLPGTVTVTNRVPPLSTSCNSQGYYTLAVPADTLWNLQAEYNLFYQAAYGSALVIQNDTVTVNFALNPSTREVIFSDDFSTNTGWTGTGGTAEWTIGAATGGAGNDSYGGPDPAADHSPTSDNKVMGNDLTPGTGGDYAASMTTTYWVTSATINCSGFTNVSLDYYRWLGVEGSTYDHAYLQAYNGTSWVALFENGSGTIDESSWSAQSYDVSAVADNNANFKIRFGLGATDGSWQYCGWNIDDIVVSGESSTPIPSVSINMIPNNPPISVPRGGSFTFTGVLTNNLGSPTTTDVWVMINVPGYGMYGPAMQANNVPLAAYQTLSYANISQYIPTFAPVGSYTYYAYCGNYPIPAIDTASFPFTVTALLDGNADSWALSGWFGGDGQQLPLTTSLVGNYPNPFNATTSISYDLASDTEVSLEIYNILGQKVISLVNGSQTAGHKNVIWDASEASSGIYLIKLNAGDKVFTKRMTLLK